MSVVPAIASRGRLTGGVIDLDAERKSWTTLVARAAMHGYQLWRSDAADGPQRFFACRWGMVKAFASAVEVDAWLERAGAR